MSRARTSIATTTTMGAGGALIGWLYGASTGALVGNATRGRRRDRIRGHRGRVDHLHRGRSQQPRLTEQGWSQ